MLIRNPAWKLTIYSLLFYVNSGVKQGDSLSPFSIFINDLARDINIIKCGVKAGIDQVSIVLYADDIALLAWNTQMLDCLN